MSGSSRCRCSSATGPAVEGIDVSPADVTSALRDRVDGHHVPADAGGVRRSCTGSPRRRGRLGALAAPVGRAVRHLRFGPAGRRRVRRRPCPGGRLPIGRRWRSGFGVLAAARPRPAGAGLDDVEQAARPCCLRRTGAVLRRLAGMAAPGRPDRRRGRPVRHRAGGQAAAAPGRRPDRPAGEGANLVQGDRPAGPAGGRRGRRRSQVDVAVQHLAAPDRAADLARQLRASAARALRELYDSEVGAAVGAHVGPGLLGIVVARAAKALTCRLPPRSGWRDAAHRLTRAVPRADRELRVERVVAAAGRCSA